MGIYSVYAWCLCTVLSNPLYTIPYILGSTAPLEKLIYFMVRMCNRPLKLLFYSFVLQPNPPLLELPDGCNG